jgi:hypothetical protein
MAWAKRQAPKRQRGYDYQFVKLRKQLLPSAYGTRCVRCGELMLPGQKLHLDHDDWDRSKLLGWSHAQCNLRAAGRKGKAVQRMAKQGRTNINKPVHRW